MNTVLHNSIPLSLSMKTEVSESIPSNLDQNPAALHIAKQGSKEGRRVVESRLNRAANVLMKPSWREVDWSSIDRSWMYMIAEIMKVEGCSPGSINGIFSALRSVAKQAWDLNFIDHERYLRIKETENVKGSRQADRTWITKDQINSLLNSSKGNSSHGIRNEAMIGLTFMSGLRRAETVQIAMNNIDFDEQSIRIIGKGNKERIIYPSNQTWELIIKWLEGYRGYAPGPLFVQIRRNGTVTNKGLTTQSLMDVLKSLCDKNDIKGVSPHDLRASFISYMLETHDIATVAAIVGHSDIKTTQKYDRRGEKAKEKAMRGFTI